MNETSTAKRRGRPPKAPREDSDTKAALIRSGVVHLTEHGFFASGIDQILKDVGVPKGSFYHYFSSKEAFGSEVLKAYDRYFAKKLDKHLQAESVEPLKRLENFVKDAQKGMARYEFKRGCLVGNLAQEVDLLPEAFRPQIIDIYKSWQHRVARCLKAAQAQGQISNNANCQRLAETFWIGWEGAVSRAKLVKNDKPLAQYYRFFYDALPW